MVLLGTLNLPTQLAFPNHLRVLFCSERPWRGRRKETELSPCYHQEFLQTLAQRPWLQASKGGGGEERLPGHSVTFRGPREGGTWPLRPELPQCPLALEGV